MKNKNTIEATTEIVEGKMTAIASTEDKDRMGESLKVGDWNFKNFKKNPVLQAGHDYRPQFTIGIAKNLRVEGKRVLFDPVFHSITQLAREIKEMFEGSILKAWSVGFIPGREEGDKNELLEISAVAVPANANALVIAKGMNSEEEKEVKEKIDKFVEDESEEDSKDEPEEAAEETEETEEAAEEDPEEKSEELEEITEEKKVEKSPACRKEDETKKECIARKVPELIDEGMEQDQAVAAAINMCSKKCSEKKEIIEKEGRVISTKNRKVIISAVDKAKEFVVALEKLLELSDTPKEVPEEKPKKEPIKMIIERKDTPKKAKGNDKKVKVEEPRVAHKQFTEEELVVRVLKHINQNSAFALHQLKK